MEDMDGFFAPGEGFDESAAAQSESLRRHLGAGQSGEVQVQRYSDRLVLTPGSEIDPNRNLSRFIKAPHRATSCTPCS